MSGIFPGHLEGKDQQKPIWMIPKLLDRDSLVQMQSCEYVNNKLWTFVVLFFYLKSRK